MATGFKGDQISDLNKSFNVNTGLGPDNYGANKDINKINSDEINLNQNSNLMKKNHNSSKKS